MKSKEKGDIAVAEAISYYTRSGKQVLIPLGDKQKYDLVIDTSDGFKKVQCKYTSSSPRLGVYEVALRITGGNQSFHTVKRYIDGDFDLLFVYTADGNKYEIPAEEVMKLKATITVGGSKYSECKV